MHSLGAGVFRLLAGLRQTEFFFLALLPPIMFEAGFSLQVKPFFRNIGAIAAMAFAGTVVSTAIVGLVMCAHKRLAYISTGAGLRPFFSFNCRQHDAVSRE